MKLCLVLSLSALAALAGEEAAPRGKLTSGTVTLFSRAKYNDYEKATFSFEKGIRDDPGGDRARNDWELLYGNGGDSLSVLMVVDDRSVIVDLGSKGFDEIATLPAFPACKQGVTTQAGAVEGHAYAVRTRDRDSDHASLFRVTKLVPGDQCTIEWVDWEPAKDTPELDLAAATRARLAAALDKAAQVEEGEPLPDRVDALLRLSTGAQGGNRSLVTLDGSTCRLPDGMEEEGEGGESGLRPRESGEQPTWRWRGGRVPKGRVLAVESIDLCAMAPGDGNGNGEAILRLPSGVVFRIRNEEGPFQVWFEGLELVRPGEESRLVAEVANSSALEVRIRGRLVTAEEAARLERKPMFPAVAPEGIPRAGGKVPGARPYLLEQPWLVLQVRSGAGGGNPNRVTMLGRGSPYLDAVSSGPVDLTKPIDMHEKSVGYTNGGRIPADKTFLVKKVTWHASAAGDSNGHGEALLMIGSQEIFRIRDSADEQKGTWTGEIEVRPGEEASLYLEVANSSLAEAWLEGEWK